MGKHKKGGKHRSHPDDEYVVEGVHKSSVGTTAYDNPAGATRKKGTVDGGSDGGSTGSSPRAGRGVRKLALARVVAAFYPKFENESADVEVRSAMEAFVAKGAAAIEASVKHSGSLFLWAGAQRGAYAKNSFGNEYSAVGVWVLSQTLKNAWQGQADVMMHQLSDHVEAHRLVVGMELVTSVLGDHGQRPLQDYVVVTSIADLTRQPIAFFSTPQIIDFCHRWRLPSNSYWICHNKRSCSQLFAAYSALSEEGTAAMVEDTLTHVADISLPGSAHHRSLQGNIIEGIVLRLVPLNSVDELRQMRDKLQVTSHVPFTVGAGTRLSPIFSTNDDQKERIRLLLSEAGPAVCHVGQWRDMLGDVAARVTYSDHDGAQEGEREGKGEGDAEGERVGKGGDSHWLARLLECQAVDDETMKLQACIRAAKGHNLPIRFKVTAWPLRTAVPPPPTLEAPPSQSHSIVSPHLNLRPAAGGEGEGQGRDKEKEIELVGEDWRERRWEEVESHFLVTVHAFGDSAFRKYKSMMRDDPSLSPLYRGFFLEGAIVHADREVARQLAERLAAAAWDDKGKGGGGSSSVTEGTVTAEGMIEGEGASEGEGVPQLMLKMKFLPYKLRTFLLRNNLGVLLTKGRDKYREAYSRQLTSWGTTTAKKREMRELCEAWADRALSLPRTSLTSDSYLTIAEPFLSAWAARSEGHSRAVGAEWMGEGEGNGQREEDSGLASHLNDEDEDEAEGGEGEEHGREDQKHKGLLIFFPGIPGCGKSALSYALLSSPQQRTEGGGVFGDGRRVDHLMGDEIEGKYWQVLAARRQKEPNVHTLADKNAPDGRVWDQIQDICEETSALGVPIVPLTRGMDQNPFDYQAMAVFMWRVLQRTNHPGKLDARTPTPGHVLLTFRSLYSGKSREDLQSDLMDRFGVVVDLPVVKPDAAEIPPEVGEVILDGIKLERKLRKLGRKVNPIGSEMEAEFIEWERQLKATLCQHSDYLDSIQVPFEEALSSVRSQLVDIATGRVGVADAALRRNRDMFGSAVSFAAAVLSLDATSAVLKAIDDLSRSNSEVGRFWTKEHRNMACKRAGVLEGTNGEEGSRAKEHGRHKNGPGVEAKKHQPAASHLHVTLAHKRSHGAAQVASYAPYVGTVVQIQAKQLLFNEDCAAIAVEVTGEAQTHKGEEGVPTDGESSAQGAVRAFNAFPHITIWTASGVPSKTSNKLPQFALEGQASIVSFPSTLKVEGCVKLV